MNVHFIIHEEFEAPGAYELWVKKHNYTATYSRVYLGDSLPHTVNNIDILVIMGGPQSPATTKEECPHYDSKAEQAIILAAVKAKKIVLGICLGSQLIGEALGAEFAHSPQKEIGKFPITLTEEGEKNPLFSHFGKALSVGHWHSDMPGLTKEAKILAYSEGCPRQIIEYSDIVYGFQCHMELTLDVVELLIAESKSILSRANTYPFVDTPEKLRSHNYNEMNEKLYTFLNKLVEYYKEKTN